MKIKINSPLVALIAISILVPVGEPLLAAPVTVPYADPFQSTSVGSDPADWVEISGAWVIANNGTQNVYNASSSAAGAFASQLQFSNLGGAATTPFTVTTSFKITDPTTSNSNEFIGFSLLNGAANLTGFYYLADIQGSNAMRIFSAGGTNPGFTGGTGNFQTILNTTTTYTLTLAGTYNSGTLNLSFTVSDGTNTRTITASDTSPLTGSYTGLRMNNATVGGGDTLAVQFDNFSVVPEPSTVAMLGLAGIGVFFMVCRRRAS